ncbi:MAG TPA: tetratricopeptide repeat protein [Alphaproteobacteria bacterium]|nr:tetratricopeptide repeat protein [Alphaproteobacteria bacterium]
MQSRPYAFSLGALATALLLAACGGAPRDVPAAKPPAPAQFSQFGSYLAARQAQAMSDSANAADFYLQSLAEDPNDPELLRRAFTALTAEGRIEEAAALAEKLRALGSGIQMAGLVRAVHAAKTGQYARAEAELNGLPEGGYNSFIAPLLRGWLIAARGEPQRGVVALAALGQTRGFEMFENFHAALILDQAGDLKAAAPYYERANASGATYLRLVQASASYFSRTGQAERARSALSGFDSDAGDAVPRANRPELAAAPLLREPLVKTPTEGMAEALFDLASLLNQQNLDDLAIVMARLALYLDPDLDIALLLTADILEDAKREAQAIEMYKRIPVASPLSWSARLRSATLLDDIGRTDEAIATLNALADERQTRPDALIALGDLLRQKERFAEAVAAYDKAFARIPAIEQRHWALLYSRGIALERAKQWPRAEADFLKALELNPDQPYVLNYLGYSWVEHGIHLDKALDMIETAVKLRPEDGYIVDSMGWVLYKLGRFEEAVPHLERAVELRPADPTINDHLGDAYWRVGREGEARFQWERALVLKPEPEQTREIEAKIKRGLSAQQRSQAPADSLKSAAQGG